MDRIRCELRAWGGPRPCGRSLALGLLLLAACRPHPAPPAPAAPAHRPPPPAQAVSAESPAQPERAAADEWWQADFLQGAKVGWAHTTIEKMVEGEQPLLRWHSEYEIKVRRFGTTITQRNEFTSVETPEGVLRHFTTKAVAGPETTVTRGEVRQHQLVMTTQAAGTSETRTIPWREEDRGFFGLEQSLRRKPMEAGEHRELSVLLPVIHQKATVKLTADAWEATDLLAGSQRLLKVTEVVAIGETAISGRIWSNTRGEILKQEVPSLQQVSYRVTAAEALEQGETGFDLGHATIVPVGPLSKSLHEARRAVLRVTLSQGEPADVFVHEPGQQVRRTASHTAEITLQAQPHEAAEAGGRDSRAPPQPEDLQPNSLIQSDDPRVVALAAEAAGDAEEPGAAACALEKWVRDHVRSTEFSLAMASAATVAETRQGDCTEHAVLLAALCRARKIPARVVVGLVYSAALQGFAYHMWNEVWLADRWQPLDGTLGRCGLGCGHLKLATSSLRSGDDAAALLPVLQVLGQLQITVVAVE